MHPTPTLPTTGPVTPTAQQIAAGRTNLLALADHTEDARNAFLVGYLHITLAGIARDVTAPAAREQLVRALAIIQAHTELSAQEAAFYTPRPDTPALHPTKVPHEGISLGRYAR